MQNKVTLITNIPSPYRIPLWDELKKLYNLNVICISKNEKNRKWNTENRHYISFLKSYHLFFQKRDWALHFSFPLTLFFRLVKQNPNVILITGYDSFQYWEALVYAKIFRKNKVMWNGSTLLSSRSKNKVINLIKGYFINSFDSYYTYGTQATKYIESFGINSKKIVTGTNTIDTNLYKTHTSDDSQQDTIIKFLYVGQLIERKGLYNTIKAFANLDYSNWKLTIVGSGEDEHMLKELVKEYKLEDKIIFVGYKQKDEIIDFYSKANVFLMPSYNEVWGLVLNEALASGLFCLSSKYAGATFDLIKNGENGYIIDPNSIEDIVQKLEKVFSKAINKVEIKKSISITYSNQAQKIFEAINIKYVK